MSPPLLLDTHALLWWMADDTQLSSTVRERMADTDQEVLVSAASLWEIAIKTRKGRLQGTRPYLEQHARLHIEWGSYPSRLIWKMPSSRVASLFLMATPSTES